MRGAFEISSLKFEISGGMWLLNSEVKEKAYQRPREIAAFFVFVDVSVSVGLEPEVVGRTDCEALQ
jgi:hypothetical protein